MNQGILASAMNIIGSMNAIATNVIGIKYVIRIEMLLNNEKYCNRYIFVIIVIDRYLLF